jgi:antitoxin VapB
MRVTVHIPDIMGPSLKRAAQTEGLSLSALTAKALESYLKQKKKREVGVKLLNLISPDAVSPDSWTELEKSRADDRA